MKLKLFAFLAIAIGVTFAAQGSAFGAAPLIGPQDHSWSVAYGPGVADVSPGGHPNIDVTLTLGTAAGHTLPPDTPFFAGATTTFGGCTVPVQPCATPALAPAGSPGHPAAHLGDNVGTIGFDIETSAVVALIGTKNIDTACVAGDTTRGCGQPPSCGQTSGGATAELHATIAAPSTPIFAATIAAGDGSVSTQADPGLPTFAFDQEFDVAKGGMPMGVSHNPDWYAPVTSALGITTAVIGRSYAIATVLTSHTSVNFLSVNPQNGTFIAVTVLSNPIAAFDSASQTQSTCPPFSSTVHQLGTSLPGVAAGTGADWSACKDYFGTPRGCAAFTTAVGGSFDSTIDAGAAGVYPYKIAVSTPPDVDGDAVTGLVLNGNYPGWDNCPVDAGPAFATDNVGNGIGAACKGAGSAVWTNSQTAPVNAQTNSAVNCVTVGGVAGTTLIATVPPFSTCQDADQDGALNTSDNCPLIQNADIATWFFANATNKDNQNNNDGDGIGNACDPQPDTLGNGHGYKAGVAFDGFGSPAAAPPWAAGSLVNWHDTCNSPITIGVVGTGAPTCIAGDVSGFDPGPLDSNGDGTADVFNPGGGAVCTEDHVADSNHNGYTDADEAATAASIAGCKTAGLVAGLGEFAPFPAGGGLSHDPISVFSVGCETNPELAKTDANLDGSTNGLDLNRLAANFTKLHVFNGDPTAETDFNGDNFTNGLDLNKLAGNFTKGVVAFCPSLGYSQKNTYIEIAWDRLATGAPPVHTLSITCTAPVLATVTTIVNGDSGRYTIPILSPVPATTIICTILIDGVAVPLTTKF